MTRHDLDELPPKVRQWYLNPDEVGTAIGQENLRRRQGFLLQFYSFFGPVTQPHLFLGDGRMTTFCTPLDLARSSLTLAHTVGLGTITVADATPFGNPTSSAPVRVTAIRASDNARVDFLVTGRSGNILTVQPTDGYVDINLSPDDIVGAYVTAATIADIHAAILGVQAALASLATQIFNSDGSWTPPSLADESAQDNSIYYSTTQSALVYKDAAGVVHTL